MRRQLNCLGILCIQNKFRICIINCIVYCIFFAVSCVFLCCDNYNNLLSVSLKFIFVILFIHSYILCVIFVRYVIGDSVVYGSPGHYPQGLLSPSPPIVQRGNKTSLPSTCKPHQRSLSPKRGGYLGPMSPGLGYSRGRSPPTAQGYEDKFFHPTNKTKTAAKKPSSPPSYPPREAYKAPAAGNKTNLYASDKSKNYSKGGNARKDGKSSGPGDKKPASPKHSRNSSVSQTRNISTSISQTRKRSTSVSKARKRSTSINRIRKRSTSVKRTRKRSTSVNQTRKKSTSVTKDGSKGCIGGSKSRSSSRSSSRLASDEKSQGNSMKKDDLLQAESAAAAQAKKKPLCELS